jgi:hypothetical protein
MEGKEVYGEDHSTGDWGIDFGGSWICREEWSFGVGLYQSGTGLLEVLGTGARISI